ncbi:hypothetical protein BsWGS_21510 [Bradybaena similaris]
MFCVLCSGLFHSIFLAGYILLTLAGPLNNRSEIDKSTTLTEGSGQGRILDAVDSTDDDASDDDYGNAAWGFYDAVDGAGGGGDDGGGHKERNALMPVEKSTEAPDNLKVTCFHCHGDGINGCDVETMLHDMQTFSISCFGKCLNLSSGSIAVYDCAYDMVTQLDTCLRNGDIQMCFCTGDFCNGPSENDTIYLTQGTPLFQHEQSPSLNVALDNHFDHNHNLDNKPRKYYNDRRKGARSERYGRKFYRNKGIGTERKTHANGSDVDGTTENQIIQSEISTEDSSQGSVRFPDVHKTQIDVLISHADSRITDNSTSMSVAVPNAIRLRLETLKSRGDMRSTNTGSTILTMSGRAMMLILLLVIPCSL